MSRPASPTALTDEQGRCVCRLRRRRSRLGGPALREVVNGLLYVLRTGWTVKLVKRARATCFPLRPKRGIGERTSAWLGTCRRLRTDVGQRLASAEFMVRLAMIGLMVRRLAPA